jgi:hypothetical protein
MMLGCPTQRHLLMGPFPMPPRPGLFLFMDFQKQLHLPPICICNLNTANLHFLHPPAKLLAQLLRRLGKLPIAPFVAPPAHFPSRSRTAQQVYPKQWTCLEERTCPAQWMWTYLVTWIVTLRNIVTLRGARSRVARMTIRRGQISRNPLPIAGSKGRQ